MYRPPRIRFFEPLMVLGRKRGFAHLATADMRGVRRIYRALKRGESVGLLPDQVPSKGDGVWAPFFGRPAYTMTLVGRLQQTSGAQILIATAQRLPEGEGYQIHIEPLEALPEDPKVAATMLNQALEKLIGRSPSQYLWGYNRYKTPRRASLSKY
jgi:KDO2-lipid IV(A) lauroyltransferase